ncbi:hypothetical protein V8D89_001134 [Ganoderma adspersum]
MASFESIRELEIASPLTADTTILATISQFRHLQALTIRITDDCTHLQGSLQALVRLKIGGSAAHIQSFLAATSPPLLQRLSILFFSDSSAQLLMQCMSSLPAYVPTTLSVLDLKSYVAFDPEIPRLMATVQPALGFSALTRFTLKFRPLPSLSDGDVLAMVSAWPALTTLRVEHSPDFSRTPSPARPRHPWPRPIRPTARILPLIAARCPNMHTLGLPDIDLAATPMPDALPPNSESDSTLPGPRHPLRVLDLEPCECTDRGVCARVAAVIDRLFPCMVLPHLYGRSYEGRDEVGWTAVVEALKAIQAARGRGSPGSEREEEVQVEGEMIRLMRR